MGATGPAPSGSAGNMVYLTSTGVAASTANLFISTSNNVGIGTTNPNSQLTMYSGTSNNAIDITGTTQVGLTGRFTAGGYLSFVITDTSHPDGYSWRFQDGTALVNSGLYFRVKYTSGDTYIKGNLGIGTTGPIDPLHVQSTTSTARLTGTTNFTTSAFIFDNRLGAYWHLNGYGNNPTTGARGAAYAAGQIICGSETNNNYENSYMAFQVCYDPQSDGTGGLGVTTERMRIKSNGNVGIGTASPGSALHTAINSATATTIATFENLNTTTTTAKSFSLQFYGNGAGGQKDAGAITMIPTDGNFGYSAMAFSVRGPFSGGSEAVAEVMRCTRTGNNTAVGIGTSSPIAGLHVRTTTQTSLYTEQYSGVGNQGSGIQCWNTNIFSPVLDNQMSCGWSSNRWTTVYATTGTINTSDSRQKMNISPSNLGLNFISNLNPVSYAWIDGGTPATEPNVVGARPGKRTFYGFLAQDVKKTLDAMDTGDFAGWTLDDPKDPDSTQGLRYTEFIAPMVKAIQELSAKNTVLEQSLASATARLDSLESRLAAAGI
jgi:hypothetical protein